MMSRSVTSRRHAFLFAAALFLLIAGFLDPGLLHRSACQVGIVTAAFMVISAFVAAKSLPKLADVFFRGSVRPWYARPGVVVFICIILPCVNVLFIIIDSLFFNITEMGQVTTQQVRMFVFMALEFLWIGLLE